MVIMARGWREVSVCACWIIDVARKAELKKSLP